jgi:hypothetical protein
LKPKITNNQTEKNNGVNISSTKSVVLEQENSSNSTEVLIIEKKAFKISCHRCKYCWFFSGSLKTATCPKCRTTVSLTRRYGKTLQELQQKKEVDSYQYEFDK